jgi:hypothetical protein
MGWWEATQDARGAEYAARVSGDVGGNSSIYGATVSIAGPARSYDRILSHAYPLKWMAKQQALVGAYLKNKPTRDNVEERVAWALALMSAVTEGLFFFNVNDILWSRPIYGDPTFAGGTSWDWAKPNVRRGGLQVPGHWAPVMEPLWRGLDALQKRVDPSIPDAVLGRSSTAFFGEIATPGVGRRHAPFFNGPLIGNCYPERVFLVPVDHHCAVWRADWWNDWIAIPQARHIPWIHGAHPLWYDPITLLRTSVGTDRNRTCDFFWRFEGGFTDRVCEAQTAAMGERGKEGWLARRFRMMAYGYRYVPEPGAHEVPSMVELSKQAAWSYQNPGSAGNTLTFQRAFDWGAYDVVGEWFATMDVRRAFDIVNEDFLNFAAAGRRKSKDVHVGFVPRDTWEEVKRAKKISNVVAKLQPAIMVVGLIVDLAQGNYGSAMANWARGLQTIIDREENEDLPIWQILAELPNVYLHSLGGADSQREGFYAYFNTCCGGIDRVMERLARSMSDCRTALRKSLVDLPILQILPAPIPTAGPTPKLQVAKGSPLGGTKLLGWGAAIAAAGAAAFYLFPAKSRQLYRKVSR